MSVMQQSSEAQDRTLGLWFQTIQQGALKLPRFQRDGDAWDRGRVTSFLNTIIHNLPVGVTLALEVAGEEKFDSRYMQTAEPAVPGPVTQHLLDGQQRLTSFWRAMHNNFEKETYFVHLPEFDGRTDLDGEVQIHCEGRSLDKNGLRKPRWVEEPALCLERGLIPVSLLRPEDIGPELEAWLKAATHHRKPREDEEGAYAKFEAFTAFQDRLKTQISLLRERVKFFNLPYLSLPAVTEKAVALQVFINMNTNSKPLSVFDIIVAEVESAVGEPLHELEANLHETCPHASRYAELRDLILSTSALLQDKLPNNRGMMDMDKAVLFKNWSKLERGLERMATFLAGQGVFDKQRLPTSSVLAVIAACYEFIPDDGDFAAKAERLLRRYLWSAFFTSRYENSAASRAFNDFKAIKALLRDESFAEENLETVPVLNRVDYPLSDADSLVAAGWPKAAGIEARGILAVGNYFGAFDFADDKKASFESLQKREYHHVFPDALLGEVGIPSSLALNCALITWKTNRAIGRKDPIAYLQERVEWADETAIKGRLRSHLISYDQLSKAHYAQLGGDALEVMLSTDFNTFLRDRADLMMVAIEELAAGGKPSLDAVWATHFNNQKLVGERVDA
ncbi:GmrSD restriction endonuclease domain-containing protein [Maricaulis sp.]|uniref:GmrSD restriction endonuclease domain-containing protein n=1 Tax=Maricaulis sp. TaxID=1486257 RepID=UPI003A8D4693